MKRIFISLALVLGFGLVQANAQGIGFGVKAETNMSNFIVTGERFVEGKFGFGASFGGFMKYNVSNNFAIQPEILFHFKNSTFERFTFVQPSDGKFRYSGVEIPIYALGQWRIGSGRFYAGVGPYIGLGFSAMESFYTFLLEGPIYNESDFFENSILRRFDFGLGAMLGYEISHRVQLNVGYKIGLLNVDVRDWSWSQEHHSWRWQTISLGLGYRF